MVRSTRTPEPDEAVWLEFAFRDAGLFAVSFPAPIDRLRSVLPSPRLFPQPGLGRPGLGTMLLVVLDVPHSDGGPFRAVSWGVEVTVDRPIMPLIGMMGELRKARSLYAGGILVTGEPAVSDLRNRSLPVVPAAVDLQISAEHILCVARDGGREMIRLSGDIWYPWARSAGKTPVLHSWDIITVHNGAVLQQSLTFNSSERFVRQGSNVHVWSDEERAGWDVARMGLGRVSRARYITGLNGALTSPVEIRQG